MDSDRVRLSATVETLVTGYGKAVVDPREYDKDSAECTRVRYMAATYGEVLPQEPAAGSQSPLVQAVNMYEGEDEFAGEVAATQARSAARGAGGGGRLDVAWPLAHTWTFVCGLGSTPNPKT
jgi:hypothetical protein